MYFCFSLSQDTFCFLQKIKNVRTHFIRCRIRNHAESGLHRTHFFPADRNQFYQRAQARFGIGFWRSFCRSPLHHCQLLCQRRSRKSDRQTPGFLPHFRISDSHLCHLYDSLQDQNAPGWRRKTDRSELYQDISQRVFTQSAEYWCRTFLARNGRFRPQCLSKSGRFYPLHWYRNWHLSVD